MATLAEHTARLAIKNAIASSRVDDVLMTRLDGSTVCFQEAGLGDLEIETEGVNGQAVRIIQSNAITLLVWPDRLDDSEPVHGDILEINNQKYEVVAFSPLPCWMWTDAWRTAIKIHAKEF